MELKLNMHAHLVLIHNIGEFGEDRQTGSDVIVECASEPTS